MPAEAKDQTYTQRFYSYRRSTEKHPLFLCGDALEVLASLPAGVIDCCMTSPPYWGHRQYEAEGIGLERDYRDYLANLAAICKELRRVVKDTGSFWLNIGDAYQSKRLLGIPWRVAIDLTDNQGWILRNDVIWNKVKGLATRCTFTLTS